MRKKVSPSNRPTGGTFLQQLTGETFWDLGPYTEPMFGAILQQLAGETFLDLGPYTEPMFGARPGSARARVRRAPRFGARPGFGARLGLARAQNRARAIPGLARGNSMLTPRGKSPQGAREDVPPSN